MSLAVLFPGFTRPPHATRSLQIALTAAGVESVAPDLSRRWWPIDYMSPGRQSRVARELVRVFPARTFVLVGHSAGAAAAVGVAGFLGSRVKGLVFIDGVDSPRGTIRSALDRPLPPYVALCGAPSPCNRHSALCRLLKEHPYVHGQVIDCPWMSHGAIEPPGTRVYERACRATVSAQEHERALAVAVEAICSFG